jgi:hypothetical protein
MPAVGTLGWESFLDGDVESYDPQGYYETQTGNKISRKSLLLGSQNILIQGKVERFFFFFFFFFARSLGGEEL